MGQCTIADMWAALAWITKNEARVIEAFGLAGPLGRDRGSITVDAQVLWSWGGIEPVLSSGGAA